MKINDVKVGMEVIAFMDNDDIGIVRRIQEHDGVVYVAWPIIGRPGETDLIDMDPAELLPIRR